MKTWEWAIHGDDSQAFRGMSRYHASDGWNCYVSHYANVVASRRPPRTFPKNICFAPVHGSRNPSHVSAPQYA
jgi:hypothetical protein